MLRDFTARAEAYGIDYNLIEAFDQPWKTNEGSVGAYWGVFDASRQAKFAWTGLVSDPDYGKVAGLAVLLAAIRETTREGGGLALDRQRLDAGIRVPAVGRSGVRSLCRLQRSSIFRGCVQRQSLFQRQQSPGELHGPDSQDLQ